MNSILHSILSFFAVFLKAVYILFLNFRLKITTTSADSSCVTFDGLVT